MKERGSDREKGSAKSCQPEIKQAGTLPIPEPLHPPQSHILPLHSLHLSATASIFRLSRLLPPFPCKEIYLKPRLPSALALCSCRAHRHTCVIGPASHRPRRSVRRRRGPLDAAPAARPRARASAGCAFVCLPAALEGSSATSGSNTLRCVCRPNARQLSADLSKNSAGLVQVQCACGSAGLKHS